MSEYEAQVILIHNENKIVITICSQSLDGWPEDTINKLLNTLQDQIKDFVTTSKEVKS